MTYFDWNNIYIFFGGVYFNQKIFKFILMFDTIFFFMNKFGILLCLGLIINNNYYEAETINL